MTGDRAVRGARSVQEWENLFRNPRSPAFAALARIYGADKAILKEKASLVLELIEKFSRQFPDGPALLVRSAGRINLIGMHIDHRGGAVNPIAIRETWCLCRPREDDVIDCANFDEALFSRKQFSTAKELGSAPIGDWDRWTQKEVESRKAAGTAGDWTNYIKAAAVYLEHIRPQLKDAPKKPLRGMDMMIVGTIPRGAGLSSSSSLVVAAAEALVRINQLKISDSELVEICGQAEWYVGTRGGAGDHAAIKFGQLERVSHLGSHPLTVDSAPFPQDLRVVLCNSLIEAKKSGGARDEFNNRIASYEFGIMLLRKKFPKLAGKIQHLRDINPTALQMNEAGIYRLLLALPERMSRKDVLNALSEKEERVQHIFGSHAAPAAGYPVRAICAFGVAECLRSELAATALKNGDTETFGEVIRVSHDGDRVTVLNSEGKRIACNKFMPDDFIENRIADLESGDKVRAEQAAMWRMPGGYDASLPELDILVDACLATHGVIAARVIGAGFGGAMHAIVHKDCVDDVIRNVINAYYEPRKLEPAAEVYSSVEGSGIFEV